MDVLHTGSTSCALQEGNDVAYTKMAWTDEALSTYFSTCASALAEWLQNRNCESGNNTRKSAFDEVGCSGSVSSPLVNHFWIDTWCESMHNKSWKWFTAWHMVCTDRQTDISPRHSTRWGLLSLTPITLYILSELCKSLVQRLLVACVTIKPYCKPLIEFNISRTK